MNPAPSSPPRGFWKKFLDDVIDDNLTAQAAAIAYYACLSLAPLVLLSLVVIGMLYPSAQEKFIDEVGALVGAEGKNMIRTIVESAAERPDLRQFAGWVGVLVLLFGASAVFAQMQDALNRIWDVQSRALTGLRGFLRRRLLSAGVLLAILFLTIVSFVVQALINLVGSAEETLLKVLWWGLSLLVYGMLFTLLYRYLPDRHIPWGTAWRGGLMTTALFLLGRALIGLYLGHTDTAGAFGSAGALVVWLLWSFYSALVFLLSAELLYSLARRRGWRWAPGEPAI